MTEQNELLTKKFNTKMARRDIELKTIGSILAAADYVSPYNPLAQCMKDGISINDFEYPDCRAVYEAAASAYSSGRTFTIIEAERALMAVGLDHMASKKLTGECIEACRPNEVHDCIKYLKLFTAKEKLLGVAQRIKATAEDDSIDNASDMVFAAHSMLMNAHHDGYQQVPLDTYVDNLIVRYKKFRSKDMSGVLRSPFPRYGKIVGPYQNGVHLIAARQKVGKSSWCFAEALQIAQQYPVATINLELDNELIIDRWAADIASVNTWELWNRFDNEELISKEDFERLIWAAEQVKKLPIVMAPPRLSLQQSFLWLRWAIETKGVRYAVLDRADKLKPDRKYHNAFEKASDYSNKITEFANDNIPLRTVVHLNRRIEIDNARAKNESDERWPTSADLRNSGDWEADAYSITLLHRLGGQEAKTELIQEIACIVEDNRNGPTGVVNFRFDKKIHHWEEVKPLSTQLPSDG